MDWALVFSERRDERCWAPTFRSAQYFGLGLRRSALFVRFVGASGRFCVGQFDLIVNSLCVEDWMTELQWPLRGAWARTAKVVHSNPTTGQPEMFSKQAGQLTMVWVLGAGHLVCLRFML